MEACGQLSGSVADLRQAKLDHNGRTTWVAGVVVDDTLIAEVKSALQACAA